MVQNCSPLAICNGVSVVHARPWRVEPFSVSYLPSPWRVEDSVLFVDPPLLWKCLGMGPTGARCPHRIVPIHLVMPLDRVEWFGVLEGELCELVESMLVVDPPLLRKCLAMGPIGARCPCSIVPMGLGMPLDRGEWSVSYTHLTLPTTGVV